MPSKLSTKDIHFMQPLFWYLGFFLITPWYDFRNREIIRPNLTKLYGIIVIVLKMTSFVYTSFDKSVQKLLERFTLSQKICLMVITVNIISLNLLTILKVGFLDKNLWRKMLTNLQRFDAGLRNIGKVEDNVLKNFYARMAFKHVLFCVCGTFSVYVWSQVSDMPFWKLYFSFGAMELYSEFLGVVVLISFVRIFQVRYDDLNGRLKTISRHDKFTQDVISLTQSHRLLGETIEIFNKIFGYQIVLIIFHTGCQIIHCFNILIFFTLSEFAEEFYYFFFLANVWILCWILYAFLLIISEMHSTIHESRRFVDLLYKMQDELLEKSEEMEVVKRLISYSKNFVRSFSGAEFFSINKGIVFSVMGNVATYLIITIQLNGSENHKLSAGN